jgi:hypothetical protein
VVLDQFDRPIGFNASALRVWEAAKDIGERPITIIADQPPQRIGCDPTAMQRRQFPGGLAVAAVAAREGASPNWKLQYAVARLPDAAEREGLSREQYRQVLERASHNGRRDHLAAHGALPLASAA